MPTKAFSQAKLLGTDNTISVASLSADIPITEKLATVDDLPSTGVIGEQAFVEETNRLYIWNGTGWYNIALINTTPTWDSGGQPAGAYELSADSPQTAITITLAASDPEGLSINYSYVTSGSMDSMSTISQDSSVFTITPKTLAQMGGAGNEGPHTGSITFRATDGVNVLPQVSSFTLNFISTIENSKYTIMHVNAIAASDNNNITDSSTNNLTTTVNGTTSASTFSPYRGGGYSWDFEGTEFYGSGDAGRGESIEAENNAAAFNVGTNNYSVEGWFRSRSSASNMRLCDFGPYDKISLTHNNSNKVDVKENGTVILTSTSDVFDDNWHFIQVIRTGGYTKLYVDGIQEDSAASTTNIDAISKIIVGAWGDYSYGFDGQIADFRFSNTARTAEVPTERLASDSNTKLFVCSKPYLVDESGTATSLGFLKDGVSSRDYPDAIAFSPYDYEEYSAADNGGSVYFDGNQDYILGNSGTNLGTGNWTVEGWMYITDTSSDRMFIDFRPFSNGDYVTLKFESSDSKMYFFAGNSNRIASNDLIVSNSWVHIALVRSSGTIKMYINGNVQTQTYASTANYLSHSTRPVIGINGDNTTSDDMYGYISDVRVAIGTAHYTTNFTPPTAPLSSTGAELHIKGTDASIIDKAQGTHIECVGSAAGTSSPAKFPGTYSLSLPGFGHWMPSPMESVKLSGTEDWTVEAWVYPTQRQSYSVVVSCGSSFALALGMVSGNFHVYNNSAGGFTDTDVNHGTYDIAANQWTHLAATRVNGNWYCYVDGTLRYQKTGGSWQSHVMNETSQYTIGALDGYSSFSGNERWYGNVQDVRITKGLARYTSNFTAPTAPLEG